MMKRLLDLIVGTLLAVILTPLILVLAVGAAISLRAWPFFVQRRVGRRGREFWMVKIRTLPPATPAYADKYAISGVATPRYCAALRALHLDELPQLYLVPIGRMSLVGPRPEMRMLHSEFDAAFAAVRTSVRPGCTGLWQVSEETAGLIKEATLYDRLYLANASMRVDLWVLWRTVLMMCRIGGPVSPEQLPQWVRPKQRIALAEIIELYAPDAREAVIDDLAFDA